MVTSPLSGTGGIAGLVVNALYRAQGISWVKGSVCLVLKFALPPFPPPLPSRVQIAKQNTHGTFDPRSWTEIVVVGIFIISLGNMVMVRIV